MFGVINLEVSFNNNGFLDELDPPYVGTGTLSFDAPAALPDGVYAWESFSDLLLSIVFPGLNAGEDVVFTHSDLTTPASTVAVRIDGGGFFFTNTGGAGDGGFGGSADFVNPNGFILSTEPINSGTLFSTFRGDTFTYPLYVVNDNTNSTRLQGAYGLIPEPSVYGFLAGFVTLGYVLSRRRLRAGHPN